MWRICTLSLESLRQHTQVARLWLFASIAAAFLPFIFSVSSNAQNSSESFSSSMDYTIFQLASEQNDASAQYLVGKKYLLGKSVDKDVKEAIKWFERAAEQNHRKAQYILGIMYLYGREVQTNYVYALKYLAQAAENSHLEAQFEMGNYYMLGLVGARQPYEAMKWYRLAADRQHSGALYALGKMLYEGDGVKADKTEGKSLIKFAVATGHSEAIKYYSNISRLHDNNASIDAANVSNNSQKTKLETDSTKDLSTSMQTLLEKAKNGNAKAQYKLGLSYLNGVDNQKNPSESIHWFIQAAQQKHTKAQYQLGILYKDGLGVNVNEKESLKWLELAATGGSEKALQELQNLLYNQLYNQELKTNISPETASTKADYRLGMMFLNGEDVNVNLKLAAHWLTEAANKNHIEAQYQLSLMFKNGSGIPKDNQQAKIWLERAAAGGLEKATYELNLSQSENTTKTPNKNISAVKPDQLLTDDSLFLRAKNGDIEAQYRLGVIYSVGNREIDRNIEKSIHWLEQAATDNHLDAQRKLGNMYLNGTEGVERNFVAASKWLSLAANKGDAESQYYLGDMFKRGLGVHKNNADAIKWFRKAAQQGFEPARKQLGGCRIC